jgi:hypothetical protein
MDGLSSAVSMKVNCDLPLTVMASSFYRLLGTKVAQGYQTANLNQILRELVNAVAHMAIAEKESHSPSSAMENYTLAIEKGMLEFCRY